MANRLGTQLSHLRGQQTHQQVMLVRQTLLAQGWDTYPATLFPAGGLATVIYTDALQTVIMVVGAVILAVKGEVWGLGKGGLSQHPGVL